MNPLVFGLTFLGSWLLIGLGVFVVLRVLAALMADQERDAETPAPAPRNGGLRGGYAALTALAGLGVAAAGAYFFANLEILP